MRTPQLSLLSFMGGGEVSHKITTGPGATGAGGMVTLSI